MTPEEAVLLCFLPASVRHLLPAPIIDPLKAKFDEAEDRLTKPDLAREKSWASRIVAIPQILQSPASLDFDAVRCVVTAMRDQVWVRIDYKKRDGSISERKEVMPLGLVHDGEVYYLIAQYRGREDFTRLRMDRLIEAERLDENFKIPNDFDLQAFVKGNFSEIKGETIRIRIRMCAKAAALLRDQPLADDQLETPDPDDDEWVLITASVTFSDRLVWWLLGQRSNIQVLEPPELRRRVRQELIDALEGYDGLGSHSPAGVAPP
jgi:predicted DNA-binding transcriptional regulator YafY